MRNFPFIDPSEDVVLTFDFSKDLANTGGTLTGTPTISVTQIYGVPITRSILLGSPQISGSQVLQAVQNVPDSCSFGITATCPITASSQVLAEGAILTGKYAYNQ